MLRPEDGMACKKEVTVVAEFPCDLLATCKKLLVNVLRASARSFQRFNLWNHRDRQKRKQPTVGKTNGNHKLVRGHLSLTCVPHHDMKLTPAIIPQVQYNCICIPGHCHKLLVLQLLPIS